MVKRVGDRHAIKIKGLLTIRFRRRLFVNLTYAVEQEVIA